MSRVERAFGNIYGIYSLHLEGANAESLNNLLPSWMSARIPDDAVITLALAEARKGAFSCLLHQHN